MVDDFRPGNVFSGVCPARHVLTVIADKWSLLLIHALAHGGVLRTAELRRRVEGISEKMLIQTLRRLERFGLVSRQAHAEVPPRVEYALTPLGHSLSEPIRALDHWVESHVVEIARAQQVFDQTNAPAPAAPLGVIAG
ncbi:helix-turn-helix transcriptional regulator [Ectopseudomonas composti]|jgi:DNA-binding HxlR family transcriptional regulator|uniref:HxlR family transcriptional regulator n=1 Tax=Ectopseudomonas composti TaxID=658457 RepID=A0A1I5S7I2_9GAMM|nr:helix-turn-helix domain-containing protein [Pseudomonas composti]EZH83141.1 HxlR family transcriptional regulator [Pseudomonas composti]SFP66639.1 transcriptional regulator, HxlR family [Pseudomonas composti]